MSEQDNRERRGLAAIKQQESIVRDSIRRGEREVDTGSFGASQLGLQSVVADRWGRLWRVDGDKLIMLSHPGGPR